MDPRTFMHSDAPANALFDEAELTALCDLSSGMFRADCADLTAYCWPSLTVTQDSAAAFLMHFGVVSYDREHGLYVLTVQGVERAQATASSTLPSAHLGKG